MTESLKLVIASGLHKATPLLVGLAIVQQAGSEYYAQLGYYVVFSIFYSSLMTAGLLPVFIREFAQRENVGELIYIYAVFVASVSLFFSAAICCLGLAQYLSLQCSIVMILLGNACGLNSLLIPVLCVCKKQQFVLVSSVCYLSISLAVALLASSVEFEVFQFLFVLPYIFMCLCLFFGCWKRFGDEFDRGKHFRYWRSVSAVALKISGVYVPNVAWMAAIFYYHHCVHQIVGNSERYSWYTLGFQLFSILVFVPNALSPLILVKLSSMCNTHALRSSLWMSATFLCVAMTVFAAACSLSEVFLIPLFQSDAVHLIRMICLGGVFAAAIAPLSNFLVSQHLSKMIGIASIAWAVIAHTGLVIFPDRFDVVFSMSYLSVFVVLLAASIAAGKHAGFQEKFG